jgi:FMN reductase
MPLIVTITGSPSASSRTAALAQHVALQLAAHGFDLASINVRDLPAGDLLTARTESPALAAALALVARADGLVIATPIYKASYTGAIKAFLDVFPHLGLAGKIVLPLATGGTLAHVLALDYALRPVLAALGNPLVTAGLFVHDKTLAATDRGVAIDADVERRLVGVVEEFAATVTLREGLRRVPQARGSEAGS